MVRIFTRCGDEELVCTYLLNCKYVKLTQVGILPPAEEGVPSRYGVERLQKPLQWSASYNYSSLLRDHCKRSISTAQAVLQDEVEISFADGW